ncbi:MAG TPA: hypothetical protein VMI94_19740 [Bryobacteraceae bacterium]|nr:hypothetical protein [Bryobacteraceae bacterium]
MSRKLTLALLLAAGIAALRAEDLRAVFSAPEFEQQWSARQLDLPEDWSAYRYLVMEFRASSPQRFQLRVHTADGIRSVLIHPFAGTRVRASIPLQAWWERPSEGSDMAAVGNKSRAGYFLGLWGPFGPLTAVQAVGVRMEHPIGDPAIEIASIRLAKDSPGDAVLNEGRPLVDELGQWIGDGWPGKAKSLDGLRKSWAREEDSLRPGQFGYCRYGGYLDSHAKATGFFRVEKIGDRWWFVDPDGHLFLSTGADVTAAWIATSTENRAGVFQALPPADLRPMDREDRRYGGASFYAWNLLRRFGPDWPAQWIDFTARRMDAWGLNTIANWSDPRLWDAHRKAYTIPLEGWYTKATYLGMPDVYSEEFARNCERAALRQCAPRKDDPWLLGYFIGNEPPWPGHESMLAGLILKGPDTPTRRELSRWLADGDTPERRRLFVYAAFDKYLAMTAAAVRKYDPNHLNLGIRFGGHPPEQAARAARVFDVCSVNIYAVAPNPEDLARLYELGGRPLLIGEFHFGTPGRGMAAGLVEVRDQQERGIAYRYYVENAAAMPAMIGAHWFQWMDEPNTGRSDGENYNIGLVDVTDQPYAELVAALQVTHRHLRAVHAGAEAPFSRKPQ